MHAFDMLFSLFVYGCGNFGITIDVLYRSMRVPEASNSPGVVVLVSVSLIGTLNSVLQRE